VLNRIEEGVVMSAETSLHTLKPNMGARKERLRVGRGEGSGHGKTSGRGGKGQTARNGGGVRAGFEGGQMPLYRRLPKVGFRSKKDVDGANRYTIVRLSALEKLDNGATVDLDTVRGMGYGRKSVAKAGLKVLGGNGSLSKKLHFKVSAISEGARQQVEALGGTVEVVGATSSVTAS
jgi:large subunit ribosomal protein L15